jgi:hypothetical protein
MAVGEHGEAARPYAGSTAPASQRFVRVVEPIRK